MWIEREISNLIDITNAERPALLLTGARQTGKSSLLTHLFPQHPYVSLDVPLEARQASESGQFFLESHGTPLIIDETQYAPELFREIKLFVNQLARRRWRLLPLLRRAAVGVLLALLGRPLRAGRRLRLLVICSGWMLGSGS